MKSGAKRPNLMPPFVWNAVASLLAATALLLPLREIQAGPAANPFVPEVITGSMKRVNAWQIAHPWMPADNSWVRGTWLTGVMAAYDATRDEAYLEQALSWAGQHEWKPGKEPAGGNVLTCTQTYLELYFLKTNRAMIEPTIAWLDSARPNTPSGAKVWYLEGGARYADSLYVGAPPLAMLAKATGDCKYIDWMNAFFWDVHHEIYSPEDGLFFRDKHFIHKKSAHGRKVFWARGNGWVFAALPRILNYLPPDEPSRGKYVALFQEMAASLARRQEPDGIWRPNLDDAAEFAMPETSGTSFFCYGFAWGIRNGLLDRDTYLPVVRKAWAGLVSYISPEGKLQWGQQIGAYPVAVKVTDSHEYVTGTFLLAGSEVLRLVQAGVLQASTASVPPAGAALLPPAALAAGPLKASAHPAAATINGFLQRQKAARDFKSTGLTSADYLRVIAGQVRAMRPYQNAEGRLIDPVETVEKYYATPCYAHSVAALAASGHTTDRGLIESGMRALDAALEDMAQSRPAGKHGDFYTWPVLLAYELYQPWAGAERKAAWADRLRTMEPQKLYGAFQARTGNWGVVNLAGEFLRHRAGFTSLDYVEDGLAGQRPSFTPLGQYAEGPMPYDLFPRHYLAGMLHLGYRGAHFEAYREWLWRGAWTSLFMQSPSGELPTGHRSSHHIWNEAEQCVTFELWANAYAEAGRLAEAGACKRAAHLSLASIRQWIRPDGSGYIVKNRYPLEARHGYETYSAHTCYNMLACSMLAQAWQFSNPAVNEQLAPADLGGYVLPLLTTFHKIIASAGGTYAEYDTMGDHHYQSTGLIRVHVKGGHPQLGPSDGCVPGNDGSGINAAVGPAWQDAGGTWHSLAEMSPLSPVVEIIEESPARAAFRVVYHLSWTNGTPGKIKLVETVAVESTGVTVTDEITGDPQAMRVVWPMLVFDGLKKTRVKLSGNSASLKLDGRGTRFTLLEPAGAALTRSGTPVKHRNGMVENAVFTFGGRQARYRIEAR